MGSGSRALLVDIFHPVHTPEFLADREITTFAGGTAFALAFLQAQRQHPNKRLWPLVRACPGGAAPKPPELHYEVKREIVDVCRKIDRREYVGGRDGNVSVRRLSEVLREVER